MWLAGGALEVGHGRDWLLEAGSAETTGQPGPQAGTPDRPGEEGENVARTREVSGDNLDNRGVHDE